MDRRAMRPRHIPGHVTAALAVAALYALLLQGFLGALTPSLAGTIHCVPGAASGGPEPDSAGHGGACCLLACRPLLAPPPGLAAPAPRLALPLAAPRPVASSVGGPAPVAVFRARGPPAA